MRVRSPKDFQRAYRTGRRARGALLVVVLCENGLGRTRLGLSVGKKIWRSAVRRNRVRRVFREAFRLTRPSLPEGVDLILVPAEPRLEPTLAETCAELERLAWKAFHRAPRPPRGSEARAASDAAGASRAADAARDPGGSAAASETRGSSGPRDSSGALDSSGTRGSGGARDSSGASDPSGAPSSPGTRDARGTPSSSDAADARRAHGDDGNGET